MWRAFDRALTTVRAISTSDIGAGQKATLIGVLLLGRLNWFWGIPVFPGEPDSLSAAGLQRQLDIIDMRLILMPDDPELTQAREAAWTLMWEYFSSQSPSSYSQCTSADEYSTLLALQNAPVEEQRGRIDYDEIKRRLPLLEYVMRWDEVKRVGRSYRGHCPIHHDTRPSMQIYADQNKWWCYVCNEGGDVIDYERARLKNERAIPA